MATANFSLHFLMPFVIAGMVIAHIALLHRDGSNNPLGSLAVVDKVSFYPYFFLKDLVGWVIFALFFFKVKTCPRTICFDGFFLQFVSLKRKGKLIRVLIWRG